jgi:hypothetical protein
VLFGGRLLQLYIYKDSGRPDFGFGRIDHLESISQGLNRRVDSSSQLTAIKLKRL